MGKPLKEVLWVSRNGVFEANKVETLAIFH